MCSDGTGLKVQSRFTTSTKQAFPPDVISPEHILDVSSQRLERMRPFSKLSFSYGNRISIVVCIRADGDAVCPITVFKGVCEPFLFTSAGSCRKVTELLPGHWTPFWRRDVESVDGRIFFQWIDIFLDRFKRNSNPNRWTVLFYDALRAHMTSEVIEKLYEGRVAVIALLAHTSGRVQPLDVSVLGPFKHFLWLWFMLKEPRSWHVNFKGKLSCRVWMCGAVYHRATRRASLLRISFLVLDEIWF